MGLVSHVSRSTFTCSKRPDASVTAAVAPAQLSDTAVAAATLAHSGQSVRQHPGGLASNANAPRRVVGRSPVRVIAVAIYPMWAASARLGSPMARIRLQRRGGYGLSVCAQDPRERARRPVRRRFRRSRVRQDRAWTALPPQIRSHRFASAPLRGSGLRVGGHEIVTIQSVSLKEDSLSFIASPADRYMVKNGRVRARLYGNSARDVFLPRSQLPVGFSKCISASAGRA